MRTVVFTDRRGYLRRVLVRDEDGDEMAEFGIPAGTPDVEHEIDWENVIKQINNILVTDNVITLFDLQRTDGINKIATVVKKAVYDLYRRKPDNGHINK